ncbi:MAG TPA: NAD-dependent epimerase/dehydratase family protein, partial [Verrucomicrobiae bacterium]|nr:NAD-dependent epimerase/dehydratase family protein [Verrucomicrobiae bacterium]
MKVLVTGGAGYIGSVCVEQLLNAGHEVRVFDHLEQGHGGAVDRRAKLIEGSLADAARVRGAVEGSEAIIHFAAYTLVGESMTDPGKYFRNNVANGINLLEAAVAAGVKKFVFSSTCATYGPPDRV